MTPHKNQVSKHYFQKSYLNDCPYDPINIFNEINYDVSHQIVSEEKLYLQEEPKPFGRPYEPKVEFIDNGKAYSLGDSIDKFLQTIGCDVAGTPKTELFDSPSGRRQPHGTCTPTSNPTIVKSSPLMTTAADESQADEAPLATSSCRKVGIRQQRFQKNQEKNWKTMFKVFCDFCKTHGHSHVPHTFDPNPRLAQWVKRQRRQYKLHNEGKPSSMTQERIQELDRVEFIWDSHELVWESRFQELQEYKKKNGDCNVPSNFPTNHKLSIWVKRQRRQYKLFWLSEPSAMTLERIAKLSELGFSWELRRTYGSTKGV